MDNTIARRRSFGFGGLVADYLYLLPIAYVGTVLVTENFQHSWASLAAPLTNFPVFFVVSIFGLIALRAYRRSAKVDGPNTKNILLVDSVESASDSTIGKRAAQYVMAFIAIAVVAPFAQPEFSFSLEALLYPVRILPFILIGSAVAVAGSSILGPLGRRI
ncbi:MAG: hypothetical protein Q3972_05950 [Corynebacterium sp.]|nr:hypothetical protein [Corynebacterium sp.]